jgi:2-keto-4-pentenoate hydratase/2-oxohepta-3-ene-1,7-dioic acid hydratase in catechol pathway
VKLYTVLFKGKERPAVEKDGALYEVNGFKDMNELIEVFAPGSGDSLSLGAALSGYTLLSPIVHPRQDIMCLGINYSDHAAEAGKFSKEAFGGERPYTIYFAKRCSEAIGPGAMIPSYPGYVDSLDYEVELGVVLGKDAKNVKPADALKYVFGYTVFNDISARNLQTRHKQWYVGKSLDGFTAMGPCIVTPDELGDIYALGIRCFVNGELRQNSITSRMIQTIEGAIADLTQGITLKAGTVIAMGTPSGVGMGMDPPTFLKPGDVVRCEIDGIGVLENTVG